MQLLFMVEGTDFGLDLGGSAGVGRGEAKNEIEKMMHYCFIKSCRIRVQSKDSCKVLSTASEDGCEGNTVVTL